MLCPRTEGAHSPISAHGHNSLVTNQLAMLVTGVLIPTKNVMRRWLHRNSPLQVSRFGEAFGHVVSISGPQRTERREFKPTKCKWTSKTQAGTRLCCASAGGAERRMSVRCRFEFKARQQASARARREVRRMALDVLSDFVKMREGLAISEQDSGLGGLRISL